MMSFALLCRNVNENVFVNISSPSSSRYTAVSDIGSPDKVRCAGQMALFTVLYVTHQPVLAACNAQWHEEQASPLGKPSI